MHKLNARVLRSFIFIHVNFDRDKTVKYSVFLSISHHGILIQLYMDLYYIKSPHVSLSLFVSLHAGRTKVKLTLPFVPRHVVSVLGSKHATTATLLLSECFRQ